MRHDPDAFAHVSREMRKKVVVEPMEALPSVAELLRVIDAALSASLAPTAKPPA
jgi:hypothetical protein